MVGGRAGPREASSPRTSVSRLAVATLSSPSERAASAWRVARAMNVDAITAVTIPMNAVPSSIATVPTSLPAKFVGVTSP